MRIFAAIDFIRVAQLREELYDFYKTHGRAIDELEEGLRGGKEIKIEEHRLGAAIGRLHFREDPEVAARGGLIGITEGGAPHVGLETDIRYRPKGSKSTRERDRHEVTLEVMGFQSLYEGGKRLVINY